LTIRSNGSLAALSLLLAGCGVVTTMSHPEPPPHVHPIDPDVEWAGIKASRAASSTGSLALVAHPTPPGHTSMVPTVGIRLMPYADGIRDELEAVLRWRYRPVSLALAAGDYLLLGEYHTLGRGPTFKVWVWLRRVAVTPGASVDVVLGDDDRLCFESWAPSGTSCR
jgi:hypothetical protein